MGSAPVGLVPTLITVSLDGKGRGTCCWDMVNCFANHEYCMATAVSGGFPSRGIQLYDVKLSGEGLSARLVYF